MNPTNNESTSDVEDLEATFGDLTFSDKFDPLNEEGLTYEKDEESEEEVNDDEKEEIYPESEEEDEFYGLKELNFE